MDETVNTDETVITEATADPRSAGLDQAAFAAADAYLDHDPMRRAALISYAVRQAAVPREDGSHLEAQRLLGMDTPETGTRAVAATSDATTQGA
jgi:hypothetical protein